MKTLAELTEREILALAIAQDYFSRDFQSAGVRFLYEAYKSDMPRKYLDAVNQGPMISSNRV
jgi:hypothetical protein